MNRNIICWPWETQYPMPTLYSKLEVPICVAELVKNGCIEVYIYPINIWPEPRNLGIPHLAWVDLDRYPVVFVVFDCIRLRSTSFAQVLVGNIETNLCICSDCVSDQLNKWVLALLEIHSTPHRKLSLTINFSQTQSGGGVICADRAECCQWTPSLTTLGDG